MSIPASTRTAGAAGRAADASAVVFPGMGASSFRDIGRFMVLDRYVRARLGAADDVLGESLLAGFRAEDGDYGPLAQVAFLVNSLALADRAEQELGLCPDLCAGPSFGHRAAAVFARALDFADAIRLTVELAGCEQDYFAAEPDDLVTQCYVRVPDEPLRGLVDRLVARGEWVEISGHLDRGCYLVSMPAGLLDEVTRTVRELGGYSMQTMRPPVHARRFAPLRRRAAAEVLPRYTFDDPALPIVADQDGRLVRTAEDVRTLVLDNLDRPIVWPEAVRTLADHGVRSVHVTGPDLLFHRLDCTADTFDVVPVTPKTAARPQPVR
jgi:[acyl-carrier-protein] S-malonyltransferase